MQIQSLANQMCDTRVTHNRRSEIQRCVSYLCSRSRTSLSLAPYMLRAVSLTFQCSAVRRPYSRQSLNTERCRGN